MEIGKITANDEWEILPPKPTKAVGQVTKPTVGKVDEWEILPPESSAQTVAPPVEDEWELIPPKSAKKTPPPPMMLTTPEGRQYPAPPVTGFTRLAGMVAKQIPGFKPLTEALSGKPGVWEEIAPQGAGEKALGAAIDFAGFMGPALGVGKLASKGIDKLLERGLGKLAPTLAGALMRRAAAQGISLGTASVANELFSGENIKDAAKAFGPGAVMGEIFGLAGMAHLPKHPIMSQIIRQVGGRVLLGDKLSKESLSSENIGQTVFNELLNTFFLAHGETPAKVFAGGIAHGKAVNFIEGMDKRPTPAEVKAAGGPVAYVSKVFNDLVAAAKPVGELAAKEEAPSVLYSQEKPKEEQLAIPGVVPPPERPEPFKPEELGGRQGVLPMPDAAPLFAGTEEKPKPPETLFYGAHELVGLPAGMERETGSERLARGKERAAKQRELGMPESKKKTLATVSDKEAFERQAVDEAVAAMREGATTYDALDPVYRPLLEKYLDAETLYELSGGKTGQPRGRLVLPAEAPARPGAGQTVTPPPLTTGEIGTEARIVPETTPPLGRAPKTLPELQSEIVRINEGRVSTEQAAALGSLVKGVARYKGLTPDAYIEGRFSELTSGEAPPEKPFFGRESTAEFIRDLNKRGITDPKMVEKILNGEPIAAVEFLADGKAVLRAFRKSNIAGMAHELGHVFRRDLSPAESSLVERVCGVRNGKWDRYSEEKWAKQFELYLKRGKAPNPELEGVFLKFRTWLGAIYQDMKSAFGPKHRIHPNITRVLDKVLGGAEIPKPSPKAVGRVTKTPVGRPVAPTKTLTPTIGEVTGPSVGGDRPSENNPVVKLVNKDKPDSANITKAVVEELRAQKKPPEWGPIKKAIRNPAYLFEKVPVLKKYIRDIDVSADHSRTLAARAERGRTAEWKKTVDPKSEFRIWTYAIGQQKGGPETLKAMGIKEITSLTPNEIPVYAGIRQNLETMYGRINEARKLLGLEPIGKVENYFTFLRKGEELEKMGHDLLNDPDAAFLTEHLNRVTDPAFFKQRRVSKKPLESKLFNIYEHYMDQAEKYIQKAPVWANSKLLLESVEYPGPDGKTQKFNWSKENPSWSTMIKDYVEFTVGKKTPSAIAYIFGEPGLKVARAINKNLGAAVLSANIRSAMIQWSSLRNSGIELGRRWLFEGVKRGAFSPSGYREAIAKSEVLLGRFFDIHQAMLSESSAGAWAKAGDIQRTLAKIGIAPMQFLDLTAAVVTWQGAYARATAPQGKGGLGLPGKDAIRYADEVVTKTQASGAPRDIAPIQRTPEGKLASVFQTFVINEWNYLAENVARRAEGDSPSEHYWKIFRAVVGTMIVNSIMEDVLKMRSPFPTPERAIIGGLRRGERVGKVAVDVAREAGEQVPILGGSIRWTTPSRVALPATAQLGYDVGRLGAKLLNAVSEHDLSKMKVADLAVFGQLFGVPGTSQALKTLRRREQGGTWKQSILGQKMETLGAASTGLSKADKALLDKYGLSKGATTTPPKKNQKAIDDLLKKYGIK